MRRTISGVAAAVVMMCLTFLPAAAAQVPSPPQVAHHVARTVDNAAAHVRRDLAPHRHHRVRHVRYVRHMRHGHVYYTRVVYYR
jgi:hypothetical protein